MVITINDDFKTISLDLAVACILYEEGFDISEDSLRQLKSIEGLFIGNRISKTFLDKMQYKLELPKHAKTSLAAAEHFQELLRAYPEYDKLRPLRDYSNKLVRKYTNLIENNADLHSEILKALAREIKYREVRLKKGEFVEAWKSLSRYIETEGWNKYLVDLPEEDLNTTAYGEQEL